MEQFTALFICKEEPPCLHPHTTRVFECTGLNVSRWLIAVLFSLPLRGLHDIVCSRVPQVADGPEVIHLWSVSPACCSSIYTYFLF